MVNDKDQGRANPAGRLGVAVGAPTYTKKQEQEQFNEVRRNIEGIIGVLNPSNDAAMRTSLWCAFLFTGVLCDDC